MNFNYKLRKLAELKHKESKSKLPLLVWINNQVDVFQKTHYNTKYPRCICGHAKSHHNAYNKKGVKHKCFWIDCPCENYEAVK